MNLTRSFLLIAGIALGGFTACNYTVGECYPRGQGSDSAGAVAGAGGSIVNPPGVGGFGDAPPKQPQDATNPPFDCNSHDTDTPAPSPAINFTFPDFPPSYFPFVTTIQDDGTGPGGGYQEAKVNLDFAYGYVGLPPRANVWYCNFTIGMPLRTEAMGKVSASRAASLSTEITEGVARDMKGKYTLPPGIFCSQFIVGVREAFKSKYPRLGAGVTNP